jgi:hypothetical protein
MLGFTGKGSASIAAESSVGSGARPGREEWPLLMIWLRHAAMLPAASRSASTSTSIAGEKGDQPSSSARDQSMRTAVPGTARAASTASSATSSAPLWP